MHIIVMGADGQTRRLSLSGTIFWIISVFMVLALVMLAFVVHLYVDTDLENRRLTEQITTNNRIASIREYTKTVDMAPEEAKRILALLDQAILTANYTETDGLLVGVPDNTDDQKEPEPAPELNPDPNPGPEPNSTAPGPGTEPASPAPNTLGQVWAQFHAGLTLPPANPQDLEVDNFKLSSRGDVTFLLRQNAEPGQRLRGRTIVVFAIAERNGVISLASAPAINLNQLEEGWTLGSKYNIVAAKVINNKLIIPEGGKILNAEVLAWDEDTKELVFRKKIEIEER
jgi:hypothetical protein